MMKRLSLFLALLVPLPALAQTPPAPLPDPSLTPPGAPANNVFKTLDQIEPRIPLNATTAPPRAGAAFVISKPGSYYLTNNIKLTTNSRAIVIVASSVTLDLNGFTIEGPDSGSTLPGVTTELSPAPTDITIQNGIIRNWGGNGLNVVRLTPQPVAIHLRNLIVANCNQQDNDFGGVSVTGSAIIENCSFRSNKGAGLVVASAGSSRSNALVRNCSAEGNTGAGFKVQGGLVTGCTARSNAGAGFELIRTLATGCTSVYNNLDGILASSSCTVTGNHCYYNGVGASNTGAGINLVDADCRVDGNTLIDNDIGIKATGTGNLIVRNTMAANTTNLDIAANNKVGKVVTPPNSGALSGTGSAAGVGAGVGTTDPFANFTY